jgi:hypothetical protein
MKEIRVCAGIGVFLSGIEQVLERGDGCLRSVWVEGWRRKERVVIRR